MFDYLIVGAGFAGSTMAERLASQLDKKVLLVDKRNHIGGNAYDRYDDSGILIHQYGPHIFHTNSKQVFDYLSQFTKWRAYQHRVLASVDGQLVPIPINLDTINQLYGLNLGSADLEKWFASVAEARAEIRTSEDVVVSKVGRELYEKFFRGYTRKQWGIDPSELDASVTARVPTRTNRDARYFTDAYQAMPLHGFTRMFEKMLSHENIKVMLNTDYREVIDFIPFKKMIYTGPVDEYFDYRYGKLPYRSLRFEFETHHAKIHVYFAGRLATYKYYNMDQVVAQALTLFNKVAAAEAAVIVPTESPRLKSPERDGKAFSFGPEWAKTNGSNGKGHDRHKSAR
jgi:UDP-galactopyranose mutase